MAFPGDIIGPTFHDGDIVSFIFDDAELTLRLPVVPYNEGIIDDICHQKDFRGVDTSDWEDCVGNNMKALVKKNWKYEDSVTYDNVVLCFLKVRVVKLNDIDKSAPYTLNSKAFSDHYLKIFVEESREMPPETRPDWPSESNHFFRKVVTKPSLDGFQDQADLGDTYPVPMAYFPLGREYCLMVTFHFDSLHYSDRKNPYSDEILHKWKLELFDDFLSHIDIEYTPEMLALIEKHKK